MISLVSLIEMAMPTKAIMAKTYYHGTPEEENVREIIKNGISITSTFAGGMKGKVYITNDIVIALTYAFQENQGLSSLNQLKKLIRPDYEPGYVLEVSGKELTDIYPDEDEIGLLLINRKNKELNNLFDTKLKNIQMRRSVLKAINLDDGKNITLGDVVNTLRDKSKEDIQPLGWLQIGELVMPYLNDEQIVSIVQQNKNIAHKGKLTVTKAWKITPRQLKRMNKPSDFFKTAERIA